MGLFESGLGAFGTWLGNKKNVQAAKDNRQQQLDFVGGLNWQPQYSQELMGSQYQKSKSPLARSYLESILTGNNPATTFSGSPNAAAVKQGQQQSKDAMYGSDAVLQRQSDSNATYNPYTTKTPDQISSTAGGVGGVGSTADAGGKRIGSQDDLYESRYPLLAKAGITSTLHDQMVADGTIGKTQFQDGVDDGKNGGSQFGQEIAKAYQSGDKQRAHSLALIASQVGFGQG